MFGQAKYEKINALLNQKLHEENTLIAVHRGSSTGNIIENTIAAYQAAILQGADIIEADIVQSKDLHYYAFHDNNEKRLFGFDERLQSLNSNQIDQLRYINSNGSTTHKKPETYNEIFPFFKGDVIFNLDRSWNYWPHFLTYLDQFKMEQQFLIKGYVNPEHLEYLNQHPIKYMYMPIVKTMEEIEVVKSYSDINFVGVEILAKDEDDIFFQDHVIHQIHNDGLFVWANSIKLDDDTDLYCKFDDDVSITKSPDDGWGRLIKKEVDIIQTDWPAILKSYLTLL
jgi:glycerophosphoryl diester phosphodiesterase